jgi:UDP-glucose 4-epimerase
MRVTVFGGSGFLGSHVCDKLSDAGHEVTIFDRATSRWLKPGQRMILGDILDEAAVREAVRGAEAVFNFAGIADIGEANELPVETVKANILGNVVLLEACRLEGVKRFVYASTVYVYSASGGFYRCSKQASELYIEIYNENFGLEYTILRYGSLYGPRADLRNAIHRFVHQAMTEGVIRYYGSPDALREYIHVEDAALASVDILKPEFANARVVLTGHQAMRVGDVMKMIGEILGGEVRFEFFSEKSSAHYEITPYSFSPRMGRKYAPPLHMDLGQGVLRVVEEMHRDIHPELQNRDGVLVRDDQGS